MTFRSRMSIAGMLQGGMLCSIFPFRVSFLSTLNIHFVQHPSRTPRHGVFFFFFLKKKPKVQVINKMVMHVPVVKETQVKSMLVVTKAETHYPMVQKTVKFSSGAVHRQSRNVSVLMQRQVPTFQKVYMTVELPQGHFIYEMVGVLVIVQKKIQQFTLRLKAVELLLVKFGKS